MQQKIYKIIKVDLATKWLSNRKYLSEIPVEGKVTGKFFKKIGYNEHYVGQVIRNGNCITLLDMAIPLTVKVFWNTHYFEDLARFVFWTFNKSFMLKLTEELESMKPSEVQRCLELLKENPLIPDFCRRKIYTSNRNNFVILKKSIKMNYTEKHIIENYSALLNGLSSSGKKELIENLSQSLNTQAEVKGSEFYNSFGAFGSDKPAEEIIGDIRSSRNFRDHEIKF